MTARQPTADEDTATRGVRDIQEARLGEREAAARIAELIAQMQQISALATKQINELTNRCEHLAAALRRVETVRTWRNEEGEELIFATDLRAALNPRAGA